ncbi:hypothetical protein DCAR_0933953 [Daucus carota subsp. sativus]|uniref:Uncharacterized protein n=1 Tax=Daucus carota subsp. sativus TaxID=79200 RepID=A0A175YEE7_DAUCS|nr:hypothetical protein DCAR_0933953 [Daucus carota subsp. sativus]
MQLPDMNSVVAYARNLVEEEEDNNVGYIIEARLVIVHIQLSDVAKGWYDRGNREEVKTCSVCLKDIENGMEFSRFLCFTEVVLIVGW